jgi:autotransporter-like protein
VQTASAAYDGWFINPNLALGHRFAIGPGLTLTPAFKARYVAAYFDGYTETGSSANLTIGGRDVQAAEERAEATLAYVRNIGANRLTLRVTGGALAQQRTAGSTVNVALLGQNFVATTPDQANVTGLLAGAGADWQIGRVARFASAEAVGTNDSTKTYRGWGGIRVGW